MIRFGIKLGLVAGAVYYSVEEGLWNDSEYTTKLCENACQAVSPYIKEVTSQIPVDLPEIPNKENISTLSRHYWNAGVHNSCVFLSYLPDYTKEYTNKGIAFISENLQLSTPAKEK